jgi:HK97 family phage major capsid protein
MVILLMDKTAERMNPRFSNAQSKLFNRESDMDNEVETKNWNTRLSGVETGIEDLRTEIMVNQHPEKQLNEIGVWTGGPIEQDDVDIIGLTAGYIKAGLQGDSSIWDKYAKKWAVSAKAVNNVPAIMPKPLFPRIWQHILQNSVFLQRVPGLPMSTLTLERPYLTQHMAVQWVGKGTQIPESNVGFDVIKYTAKKLAAFMIIDMEDIQDALPDMIPVIQRDAASQIGQFLDNYGFNGVSGATGDGDGIMTKADATTEVTIAAATYTPTYAEIWKGIGLLDTVRIRGAAFYMSPNVFANVRGLVDTQGAPIWQPSLSVQTMTRGNQMGTILGYPVYLVDVLPTQDLATPANDSGKRFMLFGNLNQWSYGNRMSLEYDFSDHFRFQNYQRPFRWILRIAFPELPAAGLPDLTKYFVTWKTA